MLRVRDISLPPPPLADAPCAALSPGCRLLFGSAQAALLLAAAALPLAGQVSGTAGQDALRTELLPGGLDAKYDGEGFLFGLGVTGQYDSNLFLEEDDAESDFTIAASPWVNYRSAPPGGARFILDGRYAPFVRAFFNNTDLNTIDHSGNLGLSYEGAKLNLSVFGSYARFAQADRFAGGFVDTSTLSFGVAGSYAFSGKTSLDASWRAAMSEYESSSLASSDSYIAQATAFWQATPLVRVGPSLRHTELESRNNGLREAWAFLLRAQYELTGKVRLSADAGIELEENSRDGGGRGAQFIGGLDAYYEMDALWSFHAGAQYQTVASPNTQNYTISDFGTSFSVTRQLARGFLRGGVSASFSNYQPVGPVAVMRDDERAFGAFLSHRLALFEQRVNLDTSVRYSTNDGQQDWSRFQFSTGFNYTF